MGTTRVRVVFDRRKSASSSKAGAVEIEIYQNRKRKWLSTGISVLPHQWSETSMVIRRTDAAFLNRQINSLYNEVDAKLSAGRTIDEIGSIRDNSFLSFISTRLSEKRGLAKGTLKHQRSFLGILRQYGKITTFDDLTPRSIHRFDAWLYTRGISVATVWDYHKRLKTYCNEAERFGYIEKSPYEGLRFEKGKPAVMRYLTMEEFRRFRDTDLSDNKKLERARDCWLFMCYTALSYVDAARFDYFRDTREENGKVVFNDTRQKTAEPYFIVLVEPALEVLRKYDYKLPFVSNQKLNEYTKIAAIRAGIDKEVTSHWARHTSAMMALNNGISLETVARMLGHADVRTTQVYAHMMTDTVEKAYDVMENVWCSSQNSPKIRPNFIPFKVVKYNE